MATIYRIIPVQGLNFCAGDVYVGSTRQDIWNRWSKHRNNYHRWQTNLTHNCSSFRLFDKYGVDNCAIVEIEQCPLENRKEREAYWIGFYNGVNKYRLDFNKQEYSRNYHKKWQQDNKERYNEYKRLRYARKKAEKDAKSDCTDESVH